MTGWMYLDEYATIPEKRIDRAIAQVFSETYGTQGFQALQAASRNGVTEYERLAILNHWRREL